MDAGADAEVGTGSARADFGTFFRAELPGLTGYCYGLLADHEAAADAAQEALTRTYARWIAVREPRAYAYLVATNLARAVWRRQARNREVVESLAAVAAPARQSEDRSLRDLVERLPPRLQTVTVLHYYADLPVAEVARLVRRPAGTVRRRLHEARRLLHTALEESGHA